MQCCRIPRRSLAAIVSGGARCWPLALKGRLANVEIRSWNLIREHVVLGEWLEASKDDQFLKTGRPGMLVSACVLFRGRESNLLNP